MQAALGELKERLGEITDLARTQYLQAWDMEVLMPPRGASFCGSPAPRMRWTRATWP